MINHEEIWQHGDQGPLVGFQVETRWKENACKKAKMNHNHQILPLKSVINNITTSYHVIYSLEDNFNKTSLTQILYRYSSFKVSLKMTQDILEFHILP